MNFSILNEVFMKKLQFVLGAVERRQTMMILNHVLLSAEKDALYLTGTDLEVELVSHIPLEKVGQTGEIAVSARKLFDLCRTLPAKAELHFDARDQKLTLTSGRSRFQLATLPAADFPEFSEFEEEASHPLTFLLSASYLRELVDQTAFAMADQDIRYFFNAACLSVEDKMISAVATDGHRLALCKKSLEAPVKENKKLIIPRKGIQEIQRLLASMEAEKISLTLASRYIQIKTTEASLRSKLIEGAYPDYQKVIPQDNEKILLLDRDAFKLHLSRVAVLSNEKVRGVRLSLNNDQLLLTTHNTEQENATDEMEVHYPYPPLEIGFNVNYLLDVLNVLSPGEVKILLKNADQGILIEQLHSHPDTTYVVMPMRL